MAHVEIGGSRVWGGFRGLAGFNLGTQITGLLLRNLNKVTIMGIQGLGFRVTIMGIHSK